MDIMTETPEQIQIECLARYGSVFATATGEAASEYWELVWDWLKAAHRDLLENPDVDYPSELDKHDLGVLNSIWAYQDAGRQR